MKKGLESLMKKLKWSMKKIYILLEKMKVKLIQEPLDIIRFIGFGKEYSDGLTKSARKSLTGAFCTNKY